MATRLGGMGLGYKKNMVTYIQTVGTGMHPVLVEYPKPKVVKFSVSSLTENLPYMTTANVFHYV